MMQKKFLGYFERHLEDYADRIVATQPEFYANAGKLIDEQLFPGALVLDIGNGGVINYDYSKCSILECADLQVSKNAVRKYENVPSIHFMKANILCMDNIQSNTYDIVIIQAVIHHLAGRSFSNTKKRVNNAISECIRVLKPNGKLLVIESTVNKSFEWLERALYIPLQLFFNLFHFGNVFQFSPLSLYALLRQNKNATVSLGPVDIPVGPSIWIMGKRIPSHITPCGASFYIVNKEK